MLRGNRRRWWKAGCWLRSTYFMGCFGASFVLCQRTLAARALFRKRLYSVEQNKTTLLERRLIELACGSFLLASRWQALTLVTLGYVKGIYPTVLMPLRLEKKLVEDCLLSPSSLHTPLDSATRARFAPETCFQTTKPSIGTRTTSPQETSCYAWSWQHGCSCHSS